MYYQGVKLVEFVVNCKIPMVSTIPKDYGILTVFTLSAIPEDMVVSAFYFMNAGFMEAKCNVCYLCEWRENVCILCPES